MQLVVIAVLSILLALSEPLPGWVLPWFTAPGPIFAAVAVATLLPPAYAWLMARRALAELEDYTDDPLRGQERFGSGMFRVQLMLAGLHSALLTTTGWMKLCNHTPHIGGWPLVGGMLAGLPFITSLMLVWIAIYPTDRAVRQIALEQYLFRGKPVRPVWPLGSYLAYNLRHQLLFILAPTAVIMTARDVISMWESELRARHPHLADMALGTVVAIVALITPVMLRYIWVTTPLPSGPLRDRLLLLCKRLRLRCAEILVWRSGGMIVNAAVMGLVAPFRYVLITDAMLEQMDDTKIEAVFGHEAGHVKHHHIPFFLMFALLTGCTASIVTVYLNQHATRHAHLAEYVYAMMAVLFAVKWTVGFGWISRRFERQADIYGVRTLSLVGVTCNDSDCRVHGAAAQHGAAKASAAVLTGSNLPVALATMSPPARPQYGVGNGPLCTTAAAIFGETLNDVAHLNGIPPETGGLRHPSISSRSRFVQEVARNPEALARFNRQILALKTGLFLISLAACALAAYKLRVDTLLQVKWF